MSVLPHGLSSVFNHNQHQNSRPTNLCRFKVNLGLIFVFHLGLVLCQLCTNECVECSSQAKLGFGAVLRLGGLAQWALLVLGVSNWR